MKTPKFITAVLNARARKKLRAMTRTLPRTAMDGDSAEPTTNLYSAFFIVLGLHVFAVAGIYTFNSIKASRLSREQPPASAAAPAKPPAPAAGKTAAPTGVAAGAPHLADKVPAAAPVLAPVNPKPGASPQHQVKAGENATKIAGEHGVKTDELLAANHLKSDAILRPGQMLTIPAPKPANKPDAPAKPVNVTPTRTTPGLHIVKKGDTATSIAKIYGLTAADLLKLNKISDAKKLQEGQPLTIPKKKG